MNVSNSRILLSTVILTALLSGCGGSSSSTGTDDGLLDDQTGTDGSGTATGSEAGTDTSGTDTGSETGTDTSGTDTGSDTGTDATGTDTGSDTGTDGNGTDTGNETGTDTSGTDTGSETGTDGNGTDTGSDTGTDGDGTDTGSETGTDTSGTDTGSDTGTDTSGTTTGSEVGSETGGEDTGSGTDKPPADNVDMLIPVVEAGSDLERVLDNLQLHVGNTLLDLNQRLTSGTELTDQQDNCLGAYDPAFGEQLTAINCGDRPLAINNIDLRLSEAAFYDTESCHASLSAGNSDNCQLQSALMIMSVEWIIPEGEFRPVPSYPGAIVEYAVKDTMLHIDNNSDALNGIFSCTVDLATGAESATASGSSCTSILEDTANQLDKLLQ